MKKPCETLLHLTVRNRYAASKKFTGVSGTKIKKNSIKSTNFKWQYGFSKFKRQMFQRRRAK